MVGDEATAAVVQACRLRAGDAKPVDEVEERLVTLRQVRDLGRPVVHLQVDVDRELAVPRGLVAVVPDPLQVGRQGAGTAGAEQQVAPELEVQFDEARVERPCLDAFEAHVRGQCRESLVRLAAESKSDAPHRRAVALDVARAEFREGPRGRGVERGAARPLVVVVAEVRRRGDEDRDRVRSPDGDVVAERHDGPALRDDACAGRERGAARSDDAAHQVVVSLDPLECVVAAVVVRSELHRSRARGLEPEHDDVVRGAREDLAPETGSAELVLHRRDPVVEVERAPVARGQLLVVPPEQQRHVAENLVARLTVRSPEHRELRERVGVVDLPLHQESTHLRQRGQRICVVAIVRPAGPDGLLVEDDRLLVDATEDCRAEPAVADRERCEPAGRGCLVPEGRSAHRGTASRMPGARMTAAISSGSIGTNPVRFSTPSEVTATVSSQRM